MGNGRQTLLDQITKNISGLTMMTTAWTSGKALS